MCLRAAASMTAKNRNIRSDFEDDAAPLRLLWRCLETVSAET